MNKLITAIIAGMFSVAVAGAYAATDTAPKGEAKGDMAKGDMAKGDSMKKDDDKKKKKDGDKSAPAPK
jgi:pentapeptide MXKDX repeat protein